MFLHVKKPVRVTIRVFRNKEECWWWHVLLLMQFFEISYFSKGEPNVSKFSHHNLKNLILQFVQRSWQKYNMCLVIVVSQKQSEVTQTQASFVTIVILNMKISLNVGLFPLLYLDRRCNLCSSCRQDTQEEIDFLGEVI